MVEYELWRDDVGAQDTQELSGGSRNNPGGEDAVRLAADVERGNAVIVPGKTEVTLPEGTSAGLGRGYEGPGDLLGEFGG